MKINESVENLIVVKSYLLVFIKKVDFKKGVIKLREKFSSANYSHIYCPDSDIELLISSRKVLEEDQICNRNVLLLSGDNSGINEVCMGENMAQAALINLDTKKGECEIFTSIVGLPPVFYYEDESMSIFTSDIHLLSCIPSVRLELNKKSVLDLCTVGHTVNNTTLFRNVTMLKCGHKIKYNRSHGCKYENNWKLEEAENKYNWSEFCESQVEQFCRAVDNIDLGGCFFSLTAGLDTRAILSAVYGRSSSVSAAYTISGVPPSLDARIAKNLCNHYDIGHFPVYLDDNFFENLEQYTLNASLLSGGIYSLEQAHEVFFYESIDSCYHGRLSGNMGNQIGRGGTEGVSVRNGDVEILSGDFLDSAEDADHENHWFSGMEDDSGTLGLMALLQNEIPNSSVGNYCIGNHYAVQKSPYAHKGLIEVAAFKPKEVAGRTLSLGEMRLRDLKHRVFGEPEERSFQRTLINKYGGFAANCPINWGWRSRGGLSASGLCLGIGAAGDSAIVKMKISNPIIMRMAHALGVSGLHVFKHSEKWTVDYLEDFVRDSIMSESTRSYFNKNKIEEVLSGFFRRNETEKYGTVTFALDLALIHRNFIATNQ